MTSTEQDKTRTLTASGAPIERPAPTLTAHVEAKFAKADARARARYERAVLSR